MAKTLVTDAPVGLLEIQTINAGVVPVSAVTSGGSSGAVGGEAELAAAQGPATSLSFQTGLITPVNEGKFLVWGTVAGDAYGLSTTEHRLWADGSGVTKISSGKASTASQSAFNCTLHGYVELDPSTSHYFLIECEVTYGGTTISCNAHEMFITWLEL